MADLEDELAALMAEAEEDQEEIVPKKAPKKKPEEKPKKKKGNWYDVDEDDGDMEDELAALMAEEGIDDGDDDDDDIKITISDDEAPVEEAESDSHDAKPAQKPAEIKQVPQKPPSYDNFDIPDLSPQPKKPAEVKKPALQPQPTPAQQIPQTPQVPKQTPQQVPQQMKPAQQIPAQQQQKQTPQMKPAAQPAQQKPAAQPAQQKPAAQPAQNKPIAQQKPAVQQKPAAQPTQQKPTAQKKAAAQTVQQNPVAQKKPEPKKVPKIIDEKSNPDYDKFFSTFASSFYTFLSTVGTQDCDKFRKQVDAMLPIVVDGPTKPLPAIKLHQPKAAPDTVSFSEFQNKAVICVDNQAQGEKTLEEINKQEKELVADIINLKKMKCDMSVIKQLLAARNNIVLTKELFPEYPYVVPDILKYGIPVVNTDVNKGYLELCIDSGEGFPTSEIEVKGILPINNVAGQPSIFASNKAKGPKPNFSFRKQFHLNLDKTGVSLLKGQKAEICIYQSGKEIGSATCSLGSIFTRATSEVKLTYPSLKNATLTIVLRVYKCLLGNELKVVERPLMISPIALYAPPTNKPAKPAAATAAKGAAAAQKPAKAPAQAPAPTAGNEAAKAKLRKPIAPQLPEYIVLTEEEMNKFWSINVIQFLMTSSSTVLSMYRTAKVAPPQGLQKMNQMATSIFETIQADVQTGRLTMDQYVAKVRQAIKRESEIIDTYPPGKPQNEARGRIGIMVKELEDF